jgi:hypothetical protein
MIVDDASQPSRKPFSILAAWYSCVTPFVTAAVVTLLLFLIFTLTPRRVEPRHADYIPLILEFSLLVFASSLILGIASLFGIQKHGLKPILLKALVGVSASLAFGCINFFFYIITAIG